MMTPVQELLSEIDAFLEKTGMPASTFGWEALNDRNFVGDLRLANREPRLGTVSKVRSFIASHAVLGSSKKEPTS